MTQLNFDTCDIASELEAAIESLKAGEEICLPSGVFCLSRKVLVKQKINITLRGSNTTLITPFSASKGIDDYKGAFDFTDCQNITLENLTFDTSENINSAGIVTAVDPDNGTFDVKCFEDCALDGHQVIRAINSMDKDGSPDYLLATTLETPYEMIDAKTARIHCKENLKSSLELLPIGEKMCFRHALGGFKVLENSAITFHNCENIVLNDITVHSSAGYMIVVFPRCHNMTINRYRVVCPKGSNRLMASNVDAIHLLGLSGKLVVNDCYFDGLGDDAVNIHSTAGTVSSVDGNCITLKNGRFDIPLDDYWCKAEDRIAVYTEDFSFKGYFDVEDYRNSRVISSNINGDIAVGDIVGNTAFYADTEITGCTVKNSRARGFLLQTENIKIKDCLFFGIALPAILLAPDVKVWHEVGPINNAVIENCVIDKCPASKRPSAFASIAVNTNHSRLPETENTIHKDITIKSNTFKNIDSDVVFVTSTDGVEIRDNVLENCNGGSNNIKLHNCKNTTVENNQRI